MLYELYIGHPPFLSESLQELVSQVASIPVPLPAPESELGMSENFEALLLALLQKNPRDRISWCVVCWCCVTHSPSSEVRRAHSFW